MNFPLRYNNIYHNCSSSLVLTSFKITIKIAFCAGAQEAFLNKTLLYRDEVVKKSIHQLSAPCYSVVLTSPQTALSLAHARKEMVRLTLTVEDKVVALSNHNTCAKECGSTFKRINVLPKYFGIIPTCLICLIWLSLPGCEFVRVVGSWSFSLVILHCCFTANGKEVD